MGRRYATHVAQGEMTEDDVQQLMMSETMGVKDRTDFWKGYQDRKYEEAEEPAEDVEQVERGAA